jgi:hypothetical protein
VTRDEQVDRIASAIVKRVALWELRGISPSVDDYVLDALDIVPMSREVGEVERQSISDFVYEAVTNDGIENPHRLAELIVLVLEVAEVGQ